MDGIHPIAIFREPESYEVLSLALADVIKEVAELSLSGIEMEGVHYRVCFSFFDIFKKIVRLLYVFILSAPVAVFLAWRGLEVPGSRDRY